MLLSVMSIMSSVGVLLDSVAVQAPWAEVLPFVQQVPIAFVLFVALRYQTQRIEKIEERRFDEEKERRTKDEERVSELAKIIERNTMVLSTLNGKGK